MRSQLVQRDVVIPSGSALSGDAATGGMVCHAVATPAAWDAANLTMQIWSGTEWQDMYGIPGTELVFTMAASRFTVVGIRGNRIRFRSGTAGTPVNQSADRTLSVFLIDQE